MKRMKCLQSASYAGLVAAAIALCYPTDAQALVHSDVVSAGKYTQPVGPSFRAFPAHPTPIFLGQVAAVSGDVITINGTLTPAALDSVLIDGVVNAPQYVIKLRHDRTGDGPQNQGDWFTISSNGANTVTVNPNGVTTTSASVAAGDIVQIEKLVTLKDVYGSGLATVLVNADDDFDVTTSEGDTIFLAAGSGFSDALVYHNPVPNSTGLPEGWWGAFSAVFYGDGSTLAFTPDQGVFNYNVAGPAYDVTLAGGIQCFNLSHFILTGFNPLATGFAAPVALGAAGLYIPPLPGATFKADTAFDVTLSDAVYNSSGSGYDKAFIYHNPVPNATGLVEDWWDAFGGTQESGFLLQPATGYYIQNLGLPYVWKEPKP